MADDPDQTAGEYVLGLLDGEERLAFQRRLARDPALVAEVGAWQARLAPLALGLEPAIPPASLWPRIEHSIGPVAANDVAPAFWRPTAIVAGVAVLVLGGIATLREMRTLAPPPAPIVASAPAGGQMMLAALSSKGETPGLFIRYDRATDKVTVMPVGLSADEAHSLELWTIRGKDAPRPMGLIDPARPVARDAHGQVGGNIVFAVSREPRGGSTTGLPTGPVLYSGALMAMPST